MIMWNMKDVEHSDKLSAASLIQLAFISWPVDSEWVLDV